MIRTRSLRTARRCTAAAALAVALLGVGGLATPSAFADSAKTSAAVTPTATAKDPSVGATQPTPGKVTDPNAVPNSIGLGGFLPLALDFRHVTASASVRHENVVQCGSDGRTCTTVNVDTASLLVRGTGFTSNQMVLIKDYAGNDVFWRQSWVPDVDLQTITIDTGLRCGHPYELSLFDYGLRTWRSWTVPANCTLR